MRRICVLGSLNMDLTVQVDRFPQPGETLTGRRFDTVPGGKGANQAVAAGRLGADVGMAGKVGEDIYGQTYLQVLAREGVDSALVGRQSGPSGIAVIEVDGAGENHIVLVPGANAHVDAAYLDEVWPLLSGYDIFLMQLEIPLETVCLAAERLRAAGKTVILDPAPAVPLPDSLLACVDILTPNQTELALLSGSDTDSESAAVAAAGKLLGKGVGAVVAKRGKQGALIVAREGSQAVPGFAVRAVDTTAAGDSFNAGLAVALAMGCTLEEAVRMGNATGALSTTGLGAQGAMPTLDQVRALMGR
ncbi:MAG: ribokinase [Christensenellales bacterium]|jgi:ribokinase